MPDLEQFNITPLGAASVSIPRFSIEARVVDSTTGALIADFTGANALIFPATLGTMTAPQRREIGELIAHRMIAIKAGID